MGLDMYAYVVPSTAYEGEVDFETPTRFREDLAEWRKHNALHGYMEMLYYLKGGKAESFNCDNVNLTLDDLNELEKVVLSNSFEKTEGFFFGADTSDGFYKEKDMKFIADAKIALSEGHKVYYTSWW